jgi:hypothetical protein
MERPKSRKNTISRKKSLIFLRAKAPKSSKTMTLAQIRQLAFSFSLQVSVGECQDNPLNENDLSPKMAPPPNLF